MFIVFPPPLDYKVYEDSNFCLFCSSLQPQYLGKYLALANAQSIFEARHLSSDWLIGPGKWHTLFLLPVIVSLEYKPLDFLWCKSAWQCRGYQFDPWSGKIPRAVEQLSPCSTTTEPKLRSPRAAPAEARLPGACASQQGKWPQQETRALQGRAALLTTAEKAHVQQRRPRATEHKEIMQKLGLLFIKKIRPQSPLQFIPCQQRLGE